MLEMFRLRSDMENDSHSPPADPAQDSAPAPDDPEIAALLDFEPVERRNKRHDGWDEARQRGFIAALATCGNVDRAAHAVDRTQSGAWTVRNSAGADGFEAAWEGALALYHARNPRPAKTPPPLKRGRRRNAPEPAPPPPPLLERDMTEREEIETIAALLQPLVDQYWYKMDEERKCRLAGRIVEADFCVRQLSFLEVMIDLGGGAEELLGTLRDHARHPIRVSATPMSLLLQQERRAYWREKGEPERQPPPPLGAHDDRVSLGPPLDFRADRDGSLREWRRRTAQEEKLAAEAQAAWEEKARAEAEAWAEREGEGQS
jgi:hypothetical protein